MTPEETQLIAAIRAVPNLGDALRVRARIRLGKESEDLQDVMQVTLVRALKQTREGRGFVPAEGWTIVDYLAPTFNGAVSDLVRRAKRKPTVAMDDEADLGARESSVEDRVAAADELARLRQAIQEGTNPHLTLGVLDGKRAGFETPKELSAHLNSTVPQIKAAIQRLVRCAKRLAETEAVS